MTGAGVEGFEAEVVENEKIGAAERFDQARMATVASGERHVLAQLWPAMIEDRAIVAAGFLTDGASQPAFADAGWADQGPDCRGRRSNRLLRAFGARSRPRAER